MTTIRNAPNIHDIANEPGQLGALPLAILADLIEEAKSTKTLADTVSKAITSELENRLNDRVAHAYRNEGKDTGTVHLEEGGFDIEVSRTKKVEWAQDHLAAAHAKISAAGDDPAEYLKVSYAVDERAYGAWPSHIRTVFEPARTVRPGPLTFKLSAAKSQSRAA